MIQERGGADDRGSGGAELRLAVVCYGGVSLAVYMHGVTKELQKLTAASRRFDGVGPDADNPFPGGQDADTEHFYFEALRGLARRGRPVSVTVDVVAGTSAGGINGVVLAKALALDAPQDGLKSLWIDEGDLKRLLRAPAVGGLRTRAVLAGCLLLTRLRTPTSPLRGERMSRLLQQALSDMDERAPGHGASLLPPDGTIDLYVTATDLHGFEVLVPTGAGGASQRDRAHAQVLHFRAGGRDHGDLGEQGTAALAFAARATSSFPGAFAPVSIDSFGRELGRHARGTHEGIARHFRESYEEAGQTAQDAYLVDGGVLDNAPFDLAMAAVAGKRAENEVVRRVFYVQPDPGRALRDSAERPQAASPSPGWLAGVWQSLAGAKGSHSILRELQGLRDLNLRVREVAAIAETQMAHVAATIDGVLAGSPGAPDAGGWDLSDEQAVRRTADRMYEAARTQLGAGHGTYCRLKVLAAGERLAREIAARFVDPPDSSRSSFVRAAVGAWARARVEWADPDPEALLAMLGPVDIPYRERRLHFLLAGVNELYDRHAAGLPAPPREDLDALKSLAWDLLEDLRCAPGRAVTALEDLHVAFLNRPSLEQVLLDDPARFAARHDDEFAALFTGYRDTLSVELGDGSRPLWQAYRERTADWDPQLRARLLSRYLGFPLWDGLIFPTVALSELPQFTPIGVTQCSPLAAGALPTPPGGKLRGVSLHHFGGFLDAAWRENDYLWGRLDGAEVLLRTLQSCLATDGRADADVVPADPAQALELAGGQVCRGALGAILDRESDLRRVADLTTSLRGALVTTGAGPV